MFRQIANWLYLVGGFLLLLISITYLDRLEEQIGCPLDLRCVTALWHWTFSKHDSAPAPIVYSDNDERIIAARRNCVRIQRRYNLERGSGVGDEHIQRFCDCFTPNLATLLTEDDLKRLASTYFMPADVQEKSQYATLWCKRLVPMLYLPTVTRPSGYNNIMSDDLPKLNASPN